MRDHSVEVHIAADAATVWRIMTDFEAWPEWTASITSARRLDSIPLGLGSQVRIEQPKLQPATWTVTAWQPDHGFTWVSQSPGVRVTAEHRIAPLPEGCHVTLRVHFGGAMGWLIGLLAGKLTRRYLQMEASGLKAKAEARK
jgi:uncharacterized membrane protein